MAEQTVTYVKPIGDGLFNFKIVKSKPLAVVDFYAEWCGPCKLLSPTLDSLSVEYQNVQFHKMNVDENPNTYTDYKVLGIPTVIFFKDGKEVYRCSGNQPKGALKEAIDKHLLGVENDTTRSKPSDSE